MLRPVTHVLSFISALDVYVIHRQIEQTPKMEGDRGSLSGHFHEAKG